MRQLKISAERITQRSENTRRYFNEVEKCQILTPDEEFNLGMLSKEGNERAIEKLISANLRFVISVAKQYSGTSIQLEELISQGNIGLCHAARTFDPTRGFKFISYAVWHIRKEILMYLNSDYRMIRIPQNVLTDITKIKRANEAILQEEQRPGTSDEIQEILEKLGNSISAKNIEKIDHISMHGIALESSDIEDSLSPIDWLSSEDSASQIVDHLDLSVFSTTVLKSLTNTEKDIVIRRLGIGMKEPESLITIAERYDRTPEWARSIYSRAIRKLQTRARILEKI